MRSLFSSAPTTSSAPRRTGVAAGGNQTMMARVQREIADFERKKDDDSGVKLHYTDDLSMDPLFSGRILLTSCRTHDRYRAGTQRHALREWHFPSRHCHTYAVPVCILIFPCLKQSDLARSRFEPPKMKFITRVYHPNVSSVTGGM